MLEAPGASIPQQMKSRAATKAAYRFFTDEGYQYADLIEPHWQQTRQAAGQAGGVVLLVNDLTELDYSRYEEQIRGLGPIGNNRGSGILLSTVLAILPEHRQVLGIAHQKPFFREAHPAQETRAQRSKRARESDIWKEGVASLGDCPDRVTWVHVGDRGADIGNFFSACAERKCHFLIRACQERGMKTMDGEAAYLMSYARSLPTMDEQELDLPARHGQPARTALLQMGYAPLQISPGWRNRKGDWLQVYVVRVWEVSSPLPPGLKAVEWVLLTSLPTLTAEQAWQCVQWYRLRWLVEEFHQCLKTGCQIEARRLEEASSLLRLLAMLAPQAVQLLNLKEQSRYWPDQPAALHFPADLVKLVAILSKRTDTDLTLHDFWRLVAQQGGYQGRKSDGPPGWKSLWHGWLYIQTLLRGFRLAAQGTPF